MKLSTALSAAEGIGGPGGTQRRKLRSELSYPKNLEIFNNSIFGGNDARNFREETRRYGKICIEIAMLL